MIDVFVDGGYAMWALLVTGALVVGLAGNAVHQLATADPADRRDQGIDAVLFWGMFSVVLGLIGTLVGVGQAARAIEAAGTAEPTLVWAGFRITLTSTIAGFGIGGISLVLWFTLRMWQRFTLKAQLGHARDANFPRLVT
jgi:hypothetical protein